MPKPEGIWIGRHSIFGNIDPYLLLPRGQATELTTLLGGRAVSAPVRLDLPRESLRSRSRVLPILDDSTERRICSGCPAPCCMILAAGLTPDEVSSRRYIMDQDESGQYYLRREYGRCIYLTGDNMCSIYNGRPLVCSSYRCDNPGEEDHRITKWFLKHL